MSLYIKPASSPRFPYRVILRGAKNSSFLHQNFALWDKIVPFFPKLVSENTFASRLHSLPLENLFPFI
uniref:Uncharacterized protein n=1 Tax=Caenorhabditis japonica TaxID=281687 RepID=A0A8R1IMR5_CAEJA